MGLNCWKGPYLIGKNLAYMMPVMALPDQPPVYRIFIQPVLRRNSRFATLSLKIRTSLWVWRLLDGALFSQQAKIAPAYQWVLLNIISLIPVQLQLMRYFP